MKQALGILLISLVSFLIVVQAAVVVFAVKPEVFGAHPGLRDSIAAAQRATVVPSAATVDTAMWTSTVASLQRENVGLRKAQDSLSQTVAKYAKQLLDAQQFVQKLSAQAVQDSAHGASAKSTASLLEAMKPDEAANILKRMRDDEVKAIVKALNRKQAGKILSQLDPARAANLMRYQ